MLKNIKLIVAFTIIQLSLSLFCSEVENTKENRNQSITTLACAVKKNYLSGVTLPLELKRLIAQYAQEWNFKRTIKLSEIGSYEQTIKFSPDGTFLVYILQGSIHIVNLNSKNPKELNLLTDKKESEHLISLDFSPNGKYLAAINTLANIKLFNFDTCNWADKLKLDYRQGGAIGQLSYLGDEILICRRSMSISCCNLNSEKCLKSLAINQANVNQFTAMCFSTSNCIQREKNTQNIIAQIVLGAQSGAIKIWDFSTNSCKFTFDSSNQGHTKMVMSLALSPTNKELLASTSLDQSIKIFDLSNNICLHTFDHSNGGHKDAVLQAIFTPDGQYLISRSTDGSIKILNLISSTCIYTFDRTSDGHTDWVTGIACSPNGSLFASRSKDGTIKLWSSREHELLYG